jgi:predicted branched-subunit amino acid permease
LKPATERAAYPTGALEPSVRRDAWVLGVAVGVFGTSFGVLATTAGLSVAQACVMSLAVFTGASQFAVVGILATGGSLASAFSSAFLLAARNAAYGVALAPTLVRRGSGNGARARHRAGGRVAGGRLARRLVAAQLVIDETTAMATAQSTPAAREQAFWITGIAVFLCWNISTAIGAVAGDAIGNPEAFGLDAAFPAGYVALSVPHVASRAGRVAAATGVAIALFLVPFTPAGVPIVAAAAGVVPALFVARRPGGGVEP